MSGGFFSLLYVVVAFIALAYLIQFYVASQWLISQIVQPYLVTPNYAAVKNDDFFAEVTFVGLDNPSSCDQACMTYIKSASKLQADVNVGPRTSSPYSSRDDCFAVLTLSDLDQLKCASLDPVYSSRVYVWTEGLYGSFQCSSFPATAIEPPSCKVRFKPDPGPFPTTFNVHFSLPETRAAAINWRVHTQTFRGRPTSVNGSFFSDKRSLSGTVPSRVQIALTPFTWNGTAAVEDYPIGSVTGFMADIFRNQVGSTMDASNFWLAAGTNLSSADIAADITKVNANGAAALSLEFRASDAGYKFTLVDNANVLDLLTRITALIGSLILGMTRRVLSLVESIGSTTEDVFSFSKFQERRATHHREGSLSKIELSDQNASNPSSSSRNVGVYAQKVNGHVVPIPSV
jgi:hypothetical protein